MTNETNPTPAEPLARCAVGIAASSRSRAVAEIEIRPGGELSICATVSDTAGGYQGGQCLDTLKAEAYRIAAEPGGVRLMDDHTLGHLLTIWHAWHGNHMRAGCEHQRRRWNISDPITTKSYSIDDDTLRRIQRGSKLAELSDSNPDAARLHFLALYSIRPHHWQEIGDDEAEGIARRFEIVTEAESIAYAQVLARQSQGLSWKWKGKHRGCYFTPKPPVMVRAVTRLSGWVTPEEHPDGKLGKPCETCGYKYGSAWLREELPPEIVAELRGIIAAAKPAPSDSDLFAALGFRLTCERIPERTDCAGIEWSKGARHWVCRLERNRAVMEFPYSQGSAYTEPPKLADVLDCLRSDARLAADESEAEACGVKLSQWETLKRQAHAFRVLCGDAAEAIGL